MCLSIASSDLNLSPVLCFVVVVSSCSYLDNAVYVAGLAATPPQLMMVVSLIRERREMPRAGSCCLTTATDDINPLAKLGVHSFIR